LPDGLRTGAFDFTTGWGARERFAFGLEAGFAAAFTVFALALGFASAFGFAPALRFARGLLARAGLAQEGPDFVFFFVLVVMVPASRKQPHIRCAAF
jgi:hypothetical protein